MKKSLIALAALATVGAAQAQSSVTVYGSYDISYDSVKFTNMAGQTGAANVANVKGINATENAAAGALTSNRIGFRGTEDLGGGLRAGFNYELGFFNNISGDTVTTSTAANTAASYNSNGTTGTNFGSAGALQTRTSRVSLESSKLGSIQAGYGLTGLFATVTGHSPLPGNNFYGDVAYSSDGTASNRIRSGADSRILAGAVRMTGVNYTTPSINGLTARLDWGTGAQKYDNGSTSNADVSNVGLTLNYAKGPLALAATAHKLKQDISTAQTAASPDNALQTVDYQAYSARYAVSSNLAVNALYAKNETKIASTGTIGKNDVQQIGVKYDMGKTSFVGQYGKGQGDIAAQSNAPYTGVAVDRARTGYQLGAIYNFSKRTNAYVLYGYQDIKYKLAETGASTGNITAGTKEKVEGYAVGLRHSF